MNVSAQESSVALSAAVRAGTFIRKSLGKVKTTAYKGEINIVTDVDRSAEGIIVRSIQRAFPDHSIFSEEMGRDERDGEFTWIIDPLDGTTNFVRSFPFFCVSIALEQSGEILLGVIYDPMREELFFSRKGEGAFLNRKRIRVSRISRLSEGFLSTGFAYGVRTAKNKNISNFSRFLKRSLAIRRAGSAALDLSYVACGRFDGFWEMELHPWDCAAGILLVKEAGGKVSQFNGKKFDLRCKEMLASNGLIHDQMVRVLSR